MQMYQLICECVEEVLPRVLCPLIADYAREMDGCEVLLDAKMMAHIQAVTELCELPSIFRSNKEVKPKYATGEDRILRFKALGYMYFRFAARPNSHEEIKRIGALEQKDLGFESASHEVFKTWIHAIYAQFYLPPKLEDLYQPRGLVLKGEKSKYVFISAMLSPPDADFLLMQKMFRRLEVGGQLQNNGLPIHVYMYYPSVVRRKYDVKWLNQQRIEQVYVHWYTYDVSSIRRKEIGNPAAGQRTVSIIEEEGRHANDVIHAARGDVIHGAIELATEVFTSTNSSKINCAE